MKLTKVSIAFLIAGAIAGTGGALHLAHAGASIPYVLLEATGMYAVGLVMGGRLVGWALQLK